MLFSCEESPDKLFSPPCYPILPAAGKECIKVVRSAAMCQPEGYPQQRQQFNDVTAVIDASNVYGSSVKGSEIIRDKKSTFI